MKTIVITGIGKGIGKALAEKFLAEGHVVIGTYLTSSLPQRENLFSFKLDLSSDKSIEECVEEIKKLNKKIDILINNAGGLFDDNETSVIIPKLRETLEVNVIGPIHFTEEILPLINSGGHIVNIASSAGSMEHTGHGSHHEGFYPSYKISKAAVNMYTRTLALRLKDSLTVSSVHPGWVKTDIGGANADITPEQAAEGIYKLAISKPETGEFWFNGEKFPW